MIDWGKPCNAFATHRYNDLAAIGDQADVAAEMIVELAHTDFVLQLLMWCHSLKYKHHKDGWSGKSIAVATR